MRAEKFAALWQGEKSPLIKFNLNTQMSEGLSESIAAELRKFGLPKTAEPWLNFMEFLMVDEKTATVLNKLNYFPIGYLANGDIICIDKDGGHIMICDHEDLTYTWMLNSSLGALYESIAMFRDFMTDVNNKNPNFTKNFKIPDGMLEKFAEQLKQIDAVSYEDKGFWYTEIQALSD